MHILLGGTGHVGSAAALRLLEMNEPVTVVSRSDAARGQWEQRGARLAVADILDTDALREVLRQGSRAFLLNPNADVATDTDAQEKRTVASILEALQGSGLEQVVVESTMGAQPGERLGDLNVLYEFEQGLQRQEIPASVIRAAYYMSNWDMSLDAVRESGRLETMLPADLAIPMVAPQDLGEAAARLLTAPRGEHGVHYVEGPQRYSANDVAEAFARALNRTVEVVVTPRDQWIAAYRKIGFSEAAAESYARMTAVSVDSGFETPAATERGNTTLGAYVEAIVHQKA